MFKCGICKQTTQPGEKATPIVVKQRTKEYSFRENAHRIRRGVYNDDPGGVGLETVKEIKVCQSCDTSYEKENTKNENTRKETSLDTNSSRQRNSIQAAQKANYFGKDAQKRSSYGGPFEKYENYR